MRRTFAICSLAAGLWAGAAAADISWRIDRFGVDSAVVIKNDGGQIFTHVKRASGQGTFRFQTFAGSGTMGALLGSYITNDRGEVVRAESADGQITEYIPNKCTRTVGECHYIVRSSDGREEQRIRITRETRSGLAFREYGPRGLMISGEMTLDKFGTSAGGWIKNHLTGQKIRSRRVVAAYR